jgi:nitrogen regulatory protein PII-like uncharacterized protein
MSHGCAQALAKAMEDLTTAQMRLANAGVENTRLSRQLAEAVRALTEIGVDGFHIEYTKGKCKHGKYDFDSCDECYEDHANSALKLIRDIGEGTV